MEYKIRDCMMHDLKQLIELCSSHAAYEQAEYSSEGKMELLSKQLFSGDPKLFCLVVEANTKIVGYASYTFDYSTWDAGTFLYMDCLYLTPQFRSHGIGREIINKLKEIALLKSCINIQWQTPDFNLKAIKFYRRLGATEKPKIRFSLSL